MTTTLATNPELAAAGARIREWRADPRRFVREVFQVEPDAWQDPVLEAFPRNQRIALQAPKGPGKTALMSWLMWNVLQCYSHPKIAAASITQPNLRDNLWAELALWRSKSPLLQRAFEWTHERVFARDHPQTWFATARAWSRDADPDKQAQTLAGLHAKNLLFVLDEAGGIPKAVMGAALGGLSTAGGFTRLVIGGNPTHLDGYCLYEACVTNRPRWRVFEITGDPEDPGRAPRVDIQHARDMIADYGRDSSLVQVDVLGKFPQGATDALISRDMFERAFDRYDVRAQLADEPRTLGVDVARYGSDKTVVCVRAGDAIERFYSWQGQDTVYTSGRVQEIARTEHATEIYVDDVGVGGGVTDQLRGSGVAAVGIDVGSAPADPKKHLNLRSELNLAMQERFRKGVIAVEPSLRNSSTLMSEGTTLRVGYSTGSRRKIEAKDEYRKRTGRSPDFWDAAVLAFVNRRISLADYGWV